MINWDAFKDLFVNRRGWVALLPAIVLFSQLIGVPVTQDMLETFGDKVLAAVMAALALLSLYRPKQEK